MTQRKNIWKGKFYQRGGFIHDKHSNVKKMPITYRQSGNGIVVDKFGNFKGFERPHNHTWGTDIHKGKKPKNFKKPTAFVRQNRIGSLKNRSAHIRRL